MAENLGNLYSVRSSSASGMGMGTRAVGKGEQKHEIMTYSVHVHL